MVERNRSEDPVADCLLREGHKLTRPYVKSFLECVDTLGIQVAAMKCFSSNLEEAEIEELVKILEED
jgi:hypothetical protein